MVLIAIGKANAHEATVLGFAERGNINYSQIHRVFRNTAGPRRLLDIDGRKA